MAELAIRAVPVESAPFVQEFLTGIAAGAVSSLKAAEDIRNLELRLEEGHIKPAVKGGELPLTPFPKDIATNTITGLLSSLKGVSEMESLKINIRSQ
jgi:hypothetical protein